MELIINPSRSEWPRLCERPSDDNAVVRERVTAILERVRTQGDQALRDLSLEIDGVPLAVLEVSETEFAAAEAAVSAEVKAAIEAAEANIRAFHEAQRPSGVVLETQPGVRCSQKAVPIQRVGLYIPGGTAPLFSTVLMLAIPARVAGCPEIILCTPVSKTSGRVAPEVLYAARRCGVSKVYKAGGAQAIAAMAYGTASIPKVDKIFGPGNQYVQCAKQLVSLADVAIDMPAGPSEVEVVADATANPSFVAADLLSQAEHGVDSQVFLITTSEKMLGEVQQEIQQQLERLPRKEIAAKSLDNSILVLVHDKQEAMDLSNTYAPEHLVISTDDYAQLAEKVVNAGSVFLGHYACESAGDYASGTNHTLPTHGYAVAYNGVNLDSYMRKITFQHLTEEGVRSIGRAVELMAENEQLDAHKNAMTVRLNSLK